MKNDNYKSPKGIKRTLNLTSLTINAMALIAPGAFLSTTFQIQAAQMNGSVSTAGEMWTGLVAALVLAFFTAVSYGELADIYPRAGNGSSYYFAEAAFLEKRGTFSKTVGSNCQIRYRMDFPSILLDIPGNYGSFQCYFDRVHFWFVRDTSYDVGKNIAAAVFAIINGYIAYRGITGSTITSVVINGIQLVSLLTFSVFAIMCRLSHPGLGYVTTVPSILLPHNFTNVIFQSTIAILLLVGFESVTAFGAEAINPKKDIRRAILLSLLIQGVFVYLFEYFAAIILLAHS